MPQRGGKLLVLLDRIELSTSPLPRECSTTELQQHCLRGSSLLGAPPQEWGEQKRRKLIVPMRFFHTLVLFLRLNGQGGDRAGFQPLQADRLTCFFTVAIAAIFHPLKGKVDLAN